MSDRELHDGRSDGLRPLESLDLSRVGSFAELIRGMSATAFGGRQLGEAFEILLEMARDPQCRVVLTLSGAMTVAKQSNRRDSLTGLTRYASMPASRQASASRRTPSAVSMTKRVR